MELGRGWGELGGFLGITDDDLVSLVIGLGGWAFVALQFRRALNESDAD